jgi:GMP synthase (glutamine-hydrolysing)
MKTLIINSYRINTEEKITPYIELVKKFSGYRVVPDVKLFSRAEFMDYDALILSGSADLITRGAWSKTYYEFLRYNTIPCLGICYGHQMLAKAFGGNIFAGLKRIQGTETVRIIKNDALFKDLSSEITVVESHLEHVDLGSLSYAGFEVLANSPSCEVEAIKHIEKLIYGVQFHAERSGLVGETIFKNFFDIVKGRKISGGSI